MGAVFSMIAPFPSSYSCFCFCFLSLLLSSYSPFNFFYVSCNLLSSSSNLCFSIFLRSSLFMHCCFFAFVAKAAFLMRGSSLNLYLFSASNFLAIFLLPLSCVGFLLIFVSFYGSVVIRDTFHYVAMLTGSLSLEWL